MTDTAVPAEKTPLGVGSIISESFSILFANFVKVLILGFVGAFAGYLIELVLVGSNTGDPFGGSVNTAAIVTATIVSVVLSVVIYSFTTALLVQLAYDSKLGRSRGMSDYFGPAIAALPALVVLGIVAGLATMVGALALIIGAIWVYAVFSVMAPAILIEKAGFQGLTRSAELTKEYRWPIVGALIILGIISWLVQMVAGLATAGLLIAFGTGFVGLIVAGIIVSLLLGLTYGLSGISVALIYARLRQIKEGVGVDEIAQVFD